MSALIAFRTDINGTCKYYRRSASEIHSILSGLNSSQQLQTVDLC
jgi:hypothetical protein